MIINPNQRITKRKDGYVSVETVNNEPSQTQQQFAKECDINVIMKPYSYNSLPLPRPSYMDLTSITDYHTMMTQVLVAQDLFQTIPAKIRSRFRNDPGELIKFLADPNNYDEGVELGLIEKKSVTTQTPNQTINSNNEPKGDTVITQNTLKTPS